MKLSGTMTRSTEECEMSRSCQSATFSSAAIAFARTSLARPVTCSQPIGVALVRHRRGALLALREWLLDLADLRFLQTSNLYREFSSDAAVMANDVSNSACRSRCRICDETGAGVSPSRSQTCASIAGSR